MLPQYPSPPTIPGVYTGPRSLLGGQACARSPPHLRGAAARPGPPAGIYWLALCPPASRLVRSVLTTSAPQRHRWTINSDTKAVGTTTEPTHAANWCFSMPPRRRKLLKHHWRWGFQYAIYWRCHLQDTGTQQGESENATTRINKIVQLLKEDENREFCELSVQTAITSRGPSSSTNLSVGFVNSFTFSVWWKGLSLHVSMFPNVPFSRTNSLHTHA